MFGNIKQLPSEAIDEIYKKIGKNVKKIRKEKNISQLELSLKLGFKSVSLVSHAENYLYKRHFNIEHLCKIAFILNTDINCFFKGVQEIIEKYKNKEMKTD
jgi:transcriptional regulator with XRE-family HTH domain